MSDAVVYAIIIIAYLALLMLVGLITGRRTKSVEDFYIGGRKVGPWVTALSFVAAYFSSVVIVGGGGFGYMFGMATLWVGAINVLIGCTVCWIVLGPRIRRFTKRLNTMTIPGFIGERYASRFALIFSAFVIVIFMVFYNVSILKGMGHIFEGLMNIPYVYGILLAGLIILFYVSIGGYLAVVWTSFLQAWVMGIGLIVLTIFSVRAIGGVSAANQSLLAIDPGLVYTPGIWGWPGLISYALIVSFGVWGCLSSLCDSIRSRMCAFSRSGPSLRPSAPAWRYYPTATARLPVRLYLASRTLISPFRHWRKQYYRRLVQRLFSPPSSPPVCQHFRPCSLFYLAR